MAENQEGSPTPLRDIVNARKRARSYPNKIEEFLEGEKTADWGVVNSSLFGSLNRDFQYVIPEGFTDMKGYIEKTLAPKKGNAIAIELGGIGSRLFSDFTPGFFQRTAAVSLSDFRDKLNPDPTEEDNARSHQVITGDMLAVETKTEIQKFLNGQKADLIISRMVEGADSLPGEQHIMANQADYFYQNLADGGIAFWTLPYQFAIGSKINEWVELVKEKYKDKLEVDYDEREAYSLRLRKLSVAPTRLPLVPIPKLRANKAAA